MLLSFSKEKLLPSEFALGILSRTAVLLKKIIISPILCVDPWDSECCELGPFVAYGRHFCEIPQDIQIGGSSMVLPPCRLPADRVWRRSVWLGHWYSPWKLVQGNHLFSSQEHWDHSICSWYSAGTYTIFFSHDAHLPAAIQTLC